MGRVAREERQIDIRPKEQAKGTSRFVISESLRSPKNAKTWYVAAKYRVEVLPGISFDLSPPL